VRIRPAATIIRLAKLASLASLTALAAATGACTNVQPWERDLHARVDMQPNAHDAAIDDHIYFSKEASSGGRGFAGGGCGCN
jgi:hypothetical protein